MTFSMTLQLSWLCMLCILMLRGTVGTKNLSFMHGICRYWMHMQLLMTSRTLTQRPFCMYLLRVQSYVHMLDFIGLGKAMHPLHLHSIVVQCLPRLCVMHVLVYGSLFELRTPANYHPQISDSSSGCPGRGDRKLGVAPRGSW